MLYELVFAVSAVIAVIGSFGVTVWAIFGKHGQKQYCANVSETELWNNHKIAQDRRRKSIGME